MSVVLLKRLFLPSFVNSEYLFEVLPVFNAFPRFDLLPSNWQTLVVLDLFLQKMNKFPDCAHSPENTQVYLSKLLISKYMNEAEVAQEMAGISLILQKMSQNVDNTLTVLNTLNSLKTQYFSEITSRKSADEQSLFSAYVNLAQINIRKELKTEFMSIITPIIEIENLLQITTTVAD